MAGKEEGVWSVVEMEVEEASRSIQMPLRSGAHADIGKGARVEDAVREAAVAVLTASSTRVAISARESRTPRSSPPCPGGIERDMWSGAIWSTPGMY